MAKKKKTTRKKKEEPVYAERSAFWPVTGALFLIILGVFVLLGGFGTGGKLPVGLFEMLYAMLGLAAYLMPIALIFWGVHKFRSEDYKVPFGKALSMFAFIILSASWLHVTFLTVDPNTLEETGKGGGIGGLLGGAVLGPLDQLPASILFLLLGGLTFMLSFGISPRAILGLFDGLKRDEPDEDEVTDLRQLKNRAIDPEFKLNEGVPVEHHEPQPKPKLSSLKNSAQKLTSTEDHQALTIASDPNWQFPAVNLLSQKQDKADPGDVQANADAIRHALANFNIDVTMEGANVGPRITQYTLKPASGVKLSKITNHADDLAYSLAAQSIRIEAPIPGKQAVGVEVPNIKSATVRMASLLQSREWTGSKSPLSFVIGKDISGAAVVGDLAKMPHLLVAGQTGSGKSVMINDILTSLLYRNSPSDLKLILVDPKTVELTPYNDIPHLLTPVITEPEKCISALKWAVAEMERRYRTLSSVKKRNIAEYNALQEEEGMPYIVIVIDELADLMMMAARDVEALIVRIAQKARAVGIHLVLATQRPSVDVITGLIKANVPGRIAFTTQSQVDSRTIIDQVGAEKLLGQGDMLLLTSDMPKPKRIQGAFISDDETNKVTDFIRAQRLPQYDDEVVSQPVQINGKGGNVMEIDSGSDEPIYQDAVRVVIEAGKASTSLLQRRLRIGYGKAARLMETMEEQGIIGAADGSRPREVLVRSMDDVFGDNTPDDSDFEPPEQPRDKFLVQ